MYVDLIVQLRQKSKKTELIVKDNGTFLQKASQRKFRHSKEKVQKIMEMLVASDHPRCGYSFKKYKLSQATTHSVVTVLKNINCRERPPTVWLQI